MRVARATVQTRRQRVHVAEKMSGRPARERLRAIINRSGITQSSIAKQMGYASTSALNRYMLESEQGDEPIPLAIVKRLIPILRGRGSPPIALEELMALTDIQDALPRAHRPVYLVPAFEDDNGGLLSVRYKIEPGVYLQLSARTERSYGTSRIGAVPTFPADRQFVAAANSSQLHCVDPDQFTQARLVKRRVLVGVPFEKGALVEIVIARVEKIQDGRPDLYNDEGMPISGEILGVIIGSYQPE